MGVKIKTFNHFNDEIINEFLKQTKGKIVNYNPIVIEYSDKNNFVDPYYGYNTYLYSCVIEFTPLSNINKEEYSFIDKNKVKTMNIDTVSFSKKDTSMKFIYKGKLVFDSGIGNNYLHIRLKTKYDGYTFRTPISTRDFQGEGHSSVDYGFSMWADSDWGDFFDFQGYLKALHCEEVNFK